MCSKATGSRRSSQAVILSEAKDRRIYVTCRVQIAWILRCAQDDTSSVSLLDDSQHIASVHRCAFADHELLKSPFLRRLDLILHLHRFNHQDAVSRLNLGPFAEKNSYDLARHWGDQPAWTVIVHSTRARS